MKLIKGFLCASAAVLVFTFCGCKKSDSSGSDGSTSSESSAFSSKFSPKVHEDAEIALGLNLDFRKLTPIGEDFFDKVSAMVEDEGEKERIAERKTKFKEFMNDPFQDQTFLKRAIKDNKYFFEFVINRLRKAKFGWAVVSIGGCEFEHLRLESKSSPELALAVSTDIDLKDMFIDAPAKGEVAERAKSNFMLEECTLADEKAWRIVPLKKRHRMKFKTKNIDPCFTSLDGELFLFASSRSALTRQIRLYRRGQSEGLLLRDFKPAHGDLVRLAVRNLDNILRTVPSQEMERSVPKIVPFDVLKRLRGINLALTAKSNRAVMLSLKLRTVSDDDADFLRARAKNAVEAFSSKQPKQLADAVKRVKLDSRGDMFEVEIDDFLSLLAAIISSNSDAHASNSGTAVRCANNMRCLAMAAISCAQADDEHGHFPAAGYYRSLTIDYNTDDPNKKRYYPHLSWISNKGNFSDLEKTLKQIYMGSVAHFTDNEKDCREVIEHGAIWQATGANFEFYRCPVHVREFKKAHKRPPGWSYMMNQTFGYDREDGKAIGFCGQSIKGPIGGRGLDKVLMFAEIQAIDIQDEEHGHIKAVPDAAETESDAVLEYAKESIGFNHRTADGRYFGHVVFADGHIEKIFCPKKGSPVDRFALTRALCEGADISYDPESGSYEIEPVRQGLRI